MTLCKNHAIRGDRCEPGKTPIQARAVEITTGGPAENSGTSRYTVQKTSCWIEGGRPRGPGSKKGTKVGLFNRARWRVGYKGYESSSSCGPHTTGGKWGTAWPLCWGGTLGPGKAFRKRARGSDRLETYTLKEQG